MSAPKRILVIGGTGAQGSAIIDELLSSKSPSFSIRVLTRDPENAQTKEKYPSGRGVELVKGSFMDLESITAALQNCYGVFVNLDSFAVKEGDETWAAMRIFEISKTVPTLRHFVWSGLDYYLKLANYDPDYACHHINAKARVNDWLSVQESSTAEDGLTWSILTTGPYMEMLHGGNFVPLIRPDGTRVYSLPLGPTGRLPLISLLDAAHFTRLIFSDRQKWSGRNLKVASALASGDEIAAALTRVAGVKAVYEPVDYTTWADRYEWINKPTAANNPGGITSRENLRMWWKAYESDLLSSQRDLPALRKIHPGLRTLDSWMLETGYDGSSKPLLKLWIDNSLPVPV